MYAGPSTATGASQGRETAMTTPGQVSESAYASDSEPGMQDWLPDEADDASLHQAINDRRAKLESAETLRLARAL